MHGSIAKLEPRRVRPRMLSRPARYIQPAAPVYQLQPPRPAWGIPAYTSPATTYGSRRYRAASSGVRVWLIGLIMWNSSTASSPLPSAAIAMMIQSAAWVYWPPFSRTPGGYALIYPGSCADRSKGGFNSSSVREPRAMSDVRTASIARSANALGTARDKTAHDCAMESMRHSSFCADPSG